MPVSLIVLNLSDTDYNVKKGDCITQLVVQKILDFSLGDYLKDSSRGNDGFGSTDNIHAARTASSDVPPLQTQTISKKECDNVTKKHQEFDDYGNMDHHDSSYDKAIRGSHPTRGLVVQVCDDRLLLKSCQPSTPAARIPKWRSVLRDAIVDSIDKFM